MSVDRVHELRWEAHSLRDHAAKVPLLEEAVREADASGDEDLAYGARMDLIDAVTFAGFKEKLLVAFAWCLARFDANPDDYSAYDVLWRFKWVLDDLPSYAQITREQISRTQDDMEARYRSFEFSLRPVHCMRWSNLMRMGELEAAQEHVALWRAAERDALADCLACERNKEVELLIRLNRDEDAISFAEPIFSRHLTCAEIPQATFGLIVRPLMRLNRDEEARDFHRRGYRSLARNRDFLQGISEHLLLLIRLRELPRAVQLFERHLPWAVETKNAAARLDFYTAGMFLMEVLARKGRARRLRLPSSLPCHHEEGKYDCDVLREWFREQVDGLIERFNQRNGNSYFTEVRDENRQIARMDA